MLVGILSNNKRSNLVALIVMLLMYAFYVFGAEWTRG
jgi:hypothetical protein